MRKFSQILLFIALVAIGLSCSPVSNFLIPLPDPTEKVKDRTGDIKLIFKPQLDILFVIDSSGSMGNHQSNLSANIDQFISGLKQTKILDYRIGVTITDFQHNILSGVLQGIPNYVDKNTLNGLALLKENLIVGTAGHHIESVFAPTINALSDPHLNGVNRGFYRQEAHLALVYVTDTTDQSDYMPLDLYNFLMDLKEWNRDKVIAYGVIIPSGEKDCQRDENREPIKIEEFLHMVEGSFFSLCASDYGQRLAAMGDDLTKRIGMFISLKQVPVLRTVQVQYGTQILPEDVKTGWSYDPGRVGINLGPQLELEDQPDGTELEVSFVPALLEAP